MATIPASGFIDGNGVYTVTWPAMGGTDDGQPVDLAAYPNQTIHVSGTMGGATVVLQGSTLVGGPWAAVGDYYTGAAITGTAAYLKRIGELPRFIRPLITGGTASVIAVSIVASK